MRKSQTTSNAIAQVFLTAFRAMPPKERRAVIAGIADHADLRKDLSDLAVIADRRHEPSRPLRQHLAEKRK
jgi:uncharacterized protein (DUF2249 family)